MNRTFATVVWLSATMKHAEAVARRDGDGDPGPSHRGERADDAAPLGERDEDKQREHREERAPGDLRGRSDRQLTLQHAGARPGKRGERHVDLAAATDAADVNRHRRGHA